MAATIILTNEFHGTEARVRPSLITSGRFTGYHRVRRATVRKLRAALCGVAGCTCGGNFGERGGSYLAVVDQDYQGDYIIDIRDSHQ